MAANDDLLLRANRRLEVTHEFEIGEFKNQNFTFKPWAVHNTGWNLTCHEMGRSPHGYFNSKYEGAFSDIENAAECSSSLFKRLEWPTTSLWIILGCLIAQLCGWLKVLLNFKECREHTRDKMFAEPGSTQAALGFFLIAPWVLLTKMRNSQTICNDIYSDFEWLNKCADPISELFLSGTY